MQVNVRPARIQDTSLLTKIGAATFALACPENTKQQDLDAYIQTELTPQQLGEHLQCPTKKLFVAEIKFHPVGYLMLCLEGCSKQITVDNALELRRLYVLPEYHGTGVSKVLMELAISQACQEKHDVIWLGVSKQNYKAITFYRKWGFEVIASQQFFVGSDIHEDYLMRLRISETRE